MPRVMQVAYLGLADLGKTLTAEPGQLYEQVSANAMDTILQHDRCKCHTAIKNNFGSHRHDGSGQLSRPVSGDVILLSSTLSSSSKSS